MQIKEQRFNENLRDYFESRKLYQIWLFYSNGEILRSFESSNLRVENWEILKNSKFNNLIIYENLFSNFEAWKILNFENMKDKNI